MSVRSLTEEPINTRKKRKKREKASQKGRLA
jgi:hypothetical protein